MDNREKSILLKTFNKHLIDLLDDVLIVYPENIEILSTKSSLETLKRMNPTAIIKAWYKFVYIPYKDYIEEGNLSFFFNKDYSKDLSHLNNSNEFLEIIEKIRGPLNDLSEVNKEHTTAYLKNLSKLSFLYTDSGPAGRIYGVEYG